MLNIEIKLLIEGKQKYIALGELESDSLDSQIVHGGYEVTEDSEFDEEFKKSIHYCEATPNARHQKLVELVQKFYPDKAYVIQINTKNK